MSRLIPCPACHSHVIVGERECPHCGVALASRSGNTAGRASAVLMGLALTGCPESVAVYGVPDTELPPAGTETNAETDTDTDAETEAQTGSGSGTADTGTASGSSDSGTAGSGTAGTSVGEPDYGVPETTSG
ncbi:MAG: hypothetical protein AB1Z98_01255 [Nannocystaceae bacterium]